MQSFNKFSLQLLFRWNHLNRFALGALQKLFSGCTLDFQAGNFTCILRMKSFEDNSFKSFLLQGKDLKYSTAVIEEIGELEQRNPCSRTDCIVSVVFICKDNDRF